MNETVLSQFYFLCFLNITVLNVLIPGTRNLAVSEGWSASDYHRMCNIVILFKLNSSNLAMDLSYVVVRITGVLLIVNLYSVSESVGLRGTLSC